jgi:Ca2+-binding EF-hand superfamily protein
MTRMFLAALPIVALLAGSLVAADDKDKKDKDAPKPTHVTISKVDAKKGVIIVKYTDDKGKEQEKTFQLTKDIQYFDETGHVAKIEVFESGTEALIIESEGKLKELRRAGRAAGPQRLSDAVRTLIEMTDAEDGYMEEVQRIYDMLRKLDTAKNGKIDPKALKAESNRILEERVQAAFDRLDTNKDGKISREEAKGLIKEHFDKIDTNKDGFIDHGELLKAAKERRDAKAAESKATEPKPSDKEKN